MVAGNSKMVIKGRPPLRPGKFLGDIKYLEPVLKENERPQTVEIHHIKANAQIKETRSK